LFEFYFEYIENASLPTNGEDNNTLMSFTMKIHEFDFCKSHLRTSLPTNGEDKVQEKNLKNKNQKFWLGDKMPKK
jgi:hypothetical protein